MLIVWTAFLHSINKGITCFVAACYVGLGLFHLYLVVSGTIRNKNLTVRAPLFDNEFTFDIP